MRSENIGRAFICLVLAFAVGTCAQGRRSFPIGLYNVTKAEDISIVKNGGFDAIQTYELEPAHLAELAAEARKSGLRVLFHPQQLVKSTFSPAAFPALAWYLADEPDVYKTPPEKLEADRAAVKDWDPHGRTAFVVGQGSAVEKYAHAADIVMVDWYPVPHLPIESVGEQIRVSVQSAGGKPVWAVLQAMDWRWFPQRDPRKPRIGRFPTLEEIRYMSYLAVAEGADGLWYYTYRNRHIGTLNDVPEYWFALSKVAKEFQSLKPVFESGRNLRPFPEGPPAGLSARAWRHGFRDYLLLVNTGPKAVPAPASLFPGDWRPLFEIRRDIRDLLANDGVDLLLKPRQILILEGRMSIRSRF